MKRLWMFTLATLLMAAMAAFAQDQATVQVSENEEHGSILTDAQGNSLYLFVDETAGSSGEQVTEGVRQEAASCTGGCLDAWPPLEGESPEAGEGIDSNLLYTTDVEGRQQVVYNGWPLYTYAQDAQPGDTSGHGVQTDTGTWYLVTPQGQPVGGVGGMAEEEPMEEEPMEEEPVGDEPVDEPMEEEPVDEPMEEEPAGDEPADEEADPEDAN